MIGFRPAVIGDLQRARQHVVADELQDILEAVAVGLVLGHEKVCHGVPLLQADIPARRADQVKSGQVEYGEIKAG
jgi:hypothetical protein